MAGHAQAQLVRRPPRRDRRVADDDDGDDLGRDGDGEEQRGRGATNVAVVGAVGRRVDDRAHDERAGQRQRRADAEERAEDGPTTSVGPQQGEQGAPARRRRRRHRPSLPPERPFHEGFARRSPLAGWFAATRTLGAHGDRHRDARRRRADAGRRSDDELVEEELLVEEISIDGMCGVY